MAATPEWEESCGSSPRASVATPSPTLAARAVRTRLRKPPQVPSVSPPLMVWSRAA